MPSCSKTLGCDPGFQNLHFHFAQNISTFCTYPASVAYHKCHEWWGNSRPGHSSLDGWRIMKYLTQVFKWMLK